MAETHHWFAVPNNDSPAILYRKLWREGPMKAQRGASSSPLVRPLHFSPNAFLNRSRSSPGTLATVGAFTMAVIKLRWRESRSLNQWMRMRVAAQAFTIATVCVHCWRPGKDTGSQTAEELQAKRDQQFDKERREFHDRLKVAEAEWKETQSLAKK